MSILENLDFGFESFISHLAWTTKEIHTPPPENEWLGGGFKDFLFSPLPGEMIQFDEHIFQIGWNHHLDEFVPPK